MACLNRIAWTVFVSGMAVSLTSCNKDERSSGPIRGPLTTRPKGQRADSTEAERRLTVRKESLGKTPAGEWIEQFVLSNQNGLTVTIINFGATVTSVEVPDRDGKFANITLGFDQWDGYFNNAPYFGAICGRYANRIAKGKFQIDAVEYTLATNNGPNHLHGGKKGFDKVIWDAQPVESDNSAGVKLTYVSRDGEEGYPGNLTATVVYSVSKDNELKIDYTATTDKPTPVNLTNHCYWNLAGAGDVLNHELTLNCDKYLPVDDTLIPTGQLQDVIGTPMEFTKSKMIGADIAKVNGGYDHCYVINEGDSELKFVAKVYDPKSGRVMEVSTTEPGVQFYTGNFLDGSANNGGFGKHQGFCLECQHFPDSPNQADFPNSILKPGEEYRQTTVHKFSAQNQE